MRLNVRLCLGVCAVCLLTAGSAMAQGGNLVSAEFGVPGSRVDVTPRVRTMIRDGNLQFEATRQVLGIDPAPGRPKDLVIRIRHWDGNTEEFAYPEKSLVSLELDPDSGYDFREQRLHVMRAYYGGEGHFVNVTERLRHLIDDGRIRTRVDNEHMGVDPDPHVHKVLRILYWYQGERHQVVVPEKAELTLP
ncbi:MAG TPA: DUF3395 domain-containing protein [Dongiaceae bacterium]|nr:DUF3395 domain-containing protein [Dongiaceae bacterium]